jgi:hypothetical protein
MKCLEIGHQETRPVGYGTIGWRARRFVLDGIQSLAPRIKPFPTGRITSGDFPGI